MRQTGAEIGMHLNNILPDLGRPHNFLWLSDKDFLQIVLKILKIFQCKLSRALLPLRGAPCRVPSRLRQPRSNEIPPLEPLRQFGQKQTPPRDEIRLTLFRRIRLKVPPELHSNPKFYIVIKSEIVIFDLKSYLEPRGDFLRAYPIPWKEFLSKIPQDIPKIKNTESQG